MCEQAKARLASGTEAEACCWAAVWDWGIAGIWVTFVKLLLDPHGTFVFGTNFQSK